MAVDLVQIRARLVGFKKGAEEAQLLGGAIEETGVAAETASKKSASVGTSLASSMKKVAPVLKSTGASMTKYLTVPILGVAAISGKMALDFDRDMRNVNSIAQLPQKQFEGLTKRVLNLAGPTAQAPHVLAEGLYDLVSSGFNANESIGILHASALAASAGLTTTEVSTKAVAAALNAYELPASKASAVSDTLFETVNRGVLTFDELASTIGDVLPFSSQLKVNLGEVGASISTMTKSGLSSAESVTRLKNAMVAFIKPSKPLSELLKEMGTTGEQIVAKKGFQGALEAIVKHTNGTKSAIAELFPNIRAMGGVLALTGLHSKAAAEDVKAFGDTTGATNKVLKEQEKSFGFQLQRAWAELQAVLIEVGQQVLPVVVPLIKDLAGALKTAVEWFGKLPKPMQEALLIFGGILAISGPFLIFLGSLIGALGTIDVLLSPILAIPAAIIAVGAAFYIAYEKIEWFHNAVDAVTSFIKANWRWLVPLMVAPFAPFTAAIILAVTHLAWLKNAFNNVVAFFRALPGRVLGAIKALPHLIGFVVGNMIKYWATLPIRIPIFIVHMGIKLVAALIHIIPSALHAAGQIGRAIAHGVVSGAAAIWGFVKTLPSKFASAVASVASQLFDVGKSIASEIAKGVAQGLSDLLPGPVKDVLGKAGGIAGEVGGFIGGLATGTAYWSGGPVLVGEQGPELVNLPRGSQVIPSGRTSRLLSGSAPERQGSGLLAGLSAAGGGGRGKIVVPVYLGRRKIAEAVVDEEADARARLGLE